MLREVKQTLLLRCKSAEVHANRKMEVTLAGRTPKYCPLRMIMLLSSEKSRKTALHHFKISCTWRISLKDFLLYQARRSMLSRGARFLSLIMRELREGLIRVLIKGMPNSVMQLCRRVFYFIQRRFRPRCPSRLATRYKNLWF